MNNRLHMSTKMQWEGLYNEKLSHLFSAENFILDIGGTIDLKATSSSSRYFVRWNTDETIYWPVHDSCANTWGLPTIPNSRKGNLYLRVQTIKSDLGNHIVYSVTPKPDRRVFVNIEKVDKKCQFLMVGFIKVVIPTRYSEIQVFYDKI